MSGSVRGSSWAMRLRIAGLSLSILVTAWLGYRTVQEWRRSATLLARQRAAEAADRLVTLLSRDMRGVQTTVLASAQWDEFMLDPPFDVRTTAASAFARYPYPESFFAWRSAAGADSAVFLNRADRRPPWMTGDAGPARFPVVVAREPAVAEMLLARFRKDAGAGRRYSAFETMIRGTRYQVVARLLYRDALRDRLEGVFGFTVNLEWVRHHYFPDVARQAARIGDSENALPLAVIDAAGARVAGVAAESLSPPIARRALPLAFFDPFAMTPGLPDLPGEMWEAAAGAGSDPALSEAVVGGSRTLAIAGAATGVFVLGLVLTVRASQARARLADLRSDFVSSVTHELKTPITAIRAAGDTMARGRVSGPEALKEYSQIVVEESKRLARLIDNLLAYARITDVTEAYTFTALDTRALLDDVEGGFRVALEHGGFDAAIDVPPGIPAIRGDRSACLLLFDNLVDNAIRYSQDERWIRVSARRSGSRVAVSVADHGMGIPADQLDQVTRKFFRGRNARSGGSGLGLAIASRIAADHGGSLNVDSIEGAGTTVTVTLPASDGRDEHTHSGG
ncbi:MAG: sensor histidine kinase [Rhodospirillaceae bacterium]